MNIHFNVFNIVLLFGTVQGLVLSLVLLLSKADKRQNRYFLATFMLVLAYNSFGTFCWSSGFYNPALDFFDRLFPYTFIFATGPSFYLYIRTSIQTERIPSTMIFKTYLPAFADFIFRICLLCYAILHNKGIIAGVSAEKIDGAYQPVARNAMVVVFWIFLISSIRLFKNAKLKIAGADVSAVQNPAVKWIRALLVVMTLVALVWAITIFGSILFNFTGIAYFAPIEITLVIFVYWIGLKGYLQTRIIHINGQKTAKTFTDTISPAETEKYAGLLTKAMAADKLYLDPELTVNKLAAHLDISPKTISAVLNGQLKKGFSGFVNDYRIGEVKEKMLHPGNNHITLAGLAFESGFNSVATFQRVFKAAENMTPKEYLSKNKKTEIK